MVADATDEANEIQKGESLVTNGMAPVGSVTARRGSSFKPPLVFPYVVEAVAVAPDTVFVVYEMVTKEAAVAAAPVVAAKVNTHAAPLAHEHPAVANVTITVVAEVAPKVAVHVPVNPDTGVNVLAAVVPSKKPPG